MPDADRAPFRPAALRPGPPSWRPLLVRARPWRWPPTRLRVSVPMRCLRSGRVVGWHDAPPRILRLTVRPTRKIERLHTVVLAARGDSARAGRATAPGPAVPITGHPRRASPPATRLVTPLGPPATHRHTELRSVTHHVAHHHRVDRTIVQGPGPRTGPERSVRAPAPAPAPPPQPSRPAPPMVVLQRPAPAGRTRRARQDERAPAASTPGSGDTLVRPPAASAERTVWTDAAIDDLAGRVLRLMDRRARAQRERQGSI